MSKQERNPEVIFTENQKRRATDLGEQINMSIRRYLGSENRYWKLTLPDLKKNKGNKILVINTTPDGKDTNSTVKAIIFARERLAGEDVTIGFEVESKDDENPEEDSGFKFSIYLHEVNPKYKS